MEESLVEVLESTVAVSKGLEALQSEHETLLEALRGSKDGGVWTKHIIGVMETVQIVQVTFPCKRLQNGPDLLLSYHAKSYST